MPVPGEDTSRYRNRLDMETTKEKCITPKCEFFGDPETNGMCSRCMLKFADENPVNPKSNTQTAVLYLDSLPSNINKNHSSSYKNWIPSRTTEKDFSITSNRCKSSRCENTVSIGTAPYCNECDLTSMQILEQAPKGPKKDHRLTEMFYRCKSDLCNQIGHPNLYGYCSTCYVRNHRLGKFTQKKQEDYQLTTPLMLSASANFHHGPQEPISDETVKTICSIPGCLENRDSNPEGMCKECYAKNMKEAYNLKPSHSLEKLALNSGSWKMPTDPPPPFNPDYHTRENKKHSKTKKKKVPTATLR